MQVDARRPSRQDTFDLRDQIHADEHMHDDGQNYGTDDEEHSVLEDDSDGEEHDEYMDDDDVSSDLSIPNESIDFDLVYAFHSFAATVEGQANVVKGDSLFLMDDSNSYWWLVRVLKTQEVGYIPAENIETPFERLARLNKHRNVDLASATQAEMQDGLHPSSQERLRKNMGSRQGTNKSPSPIPKNNRRRPKSVTFVRAHPVHRYPPAVWHDDEEDDPDTEWDLEPYEKEDSDYEELPPERQEQVDVDMEPDDGMRWEDAAADENRARQAAQARVSTQGQNVPQSLRPGSTIEQQRLQQQQQQQEILQQQQQQQLQLQQQQQSERQQQLQQQQQQQQQQRSVRPASTREQDNIRNNDPSLDTDTRKLTLTPSVAYDDEQAARMARPLGPSALLQRQQEENAKRLREEESEDSLRKRAKGKDKMAAPVSSSSLAKGNGKLRKENPKADIMSDDESKDRKKKSGGVFGGLFGRKSKKDKGSIDEGNRNSDDMRRSESTISPTTAIAMQQQQQQQAMNIRSDPKQQSAQPGQQVSQHASQLRQRDQQQQALYQQYLNRSPASPPEAQPSYGLQSASAVMPPSSYHGPSSSGSGLSPPATRQRPGSLILTPSAMDGQGVPDLSVIRVFAGKNLQTEATFKTVLLNSSTSSAELVRQAIQRFRLPAAEDENDYYLTVKQVEGSSAILRGTEKPLVVFESLVEAAMELPKVKRSSVGSISSVASNLSMHPAIKKLSMNDFTDDSAVKFYLNRRSGDGQNDNVSNEGDETLTAADTSMTESSESSQFLNVSNSNVSDRFSSPSYRFVLQLVIYPDDLPDDMVFDPLTEAIVFKDTLRDRPAAGSVASPGISQSLRRKVFVFPKNVTVAEVIEVGLERFGIIEGVVDGGDEVEDKANKRRSVTRVRYTLAVNISGQERELSPSGRVIEAFPRQPTFRSVDKKFQDKRRSIDSTQLLGSIEDINPNDPVFILRRATSYRSSTSRHRLSAPLDEIALAKLHRESASSVGSDGSEAKAKHQPSRQEIIAAQRAARRNNQQQAILSAQANSERGVDVLLPGNAMLRSSRYEVGDRMRYSYVEPDGETYDISDIIEEEWRESNFASQNDLLEGVLVGQNRDGIGEKLDRVLSKLRKQGGPVAQLQKSTASMRSASPSSQYSNPIDDGDPRPRSTTPNSRTPIPPIAARAFSPANLGRSSPVSMDIAGNRILSSSTPTAKPASRRNPSVASVMSDSSGYATPATHPRGLSEATTTGRATPKINPLKHRKLIEEDFGVSHMLAIIEYKGSKPKAPPQPLDPVDSLLFGRQIDIHSLHPKIKDIYANGFKQLDDFDKMLDNLLMESNRIP